MLHYQNVKCFIHASFEAFKLRSFGLWRGVVLW